MVEFSNKEQLGLVNEGDPVLSTPTQAWDFTNPPMDALDLTHSMTQVMWDSKGVGLAAPQVGLSYRVFTMGYGDRWWACFNPEILEYSEDTAKSAEGCLSFPGLTLDIERPKAVKVRYQDTSGAVKEDYLEGLWARCFQHELDHLNGVCFVDKVSKLVLNMAMRKRTKLLRRKAQ